MMRIFLAALMTLMLALPAAAQNAAGVFGPVVTEGRQVAEYRYSVAEPGDDLSAPWVQRVFYERSVGGRVSGRLEYQWREPAGDADSEFDFLRAMAFIEGGKVTDSWTTGFRLDARIRNGDRPDDLGVHWTNQFQLGPKTRARLIGMTFYEFGDRAADGVRFETRASVIRTFAKGHRAGVEFYNVWGDSAEFPSFAQTRHEVAPVINWELPGKLSLYTSLGFGLSDAAPDMTFRMRVQRRL